MWVDPTGNFASTCVFFPDRTIDEYALSSFTAALSLYDCLSDFTEGSAQVSIKWPNDILLNQKKVAGILLETIAVGKNKIALSIGFGVNLLSYPGLQSWKKVPSVLHLFDRNWSCHRST